ncbi:hypothetical protein [Altererythrobacter sp. MF3-039]|uniref:hypothetical protein n=1 Tax=Altererythrobacter sp. MF3-039 TaxID=3252901 RepID=UPI00390CD3CF
MAPFQTAASNMARIVIGYFVASLAASVGLFVVGALVSIGDPQIEGRTAIGDLANQAGYIPMFAAFAAVFAAPVALLAIIASEIAKIDKLWYFLLAGALAAIPVLFAGKERSTAEMLEGFVMFAPIGALASGAFWLIRHRKWPV